jgi:hypothetical protein
MSARPAPFIAAVRLSAAHSAFLRCSAGLYASACYRGVSVSSLLGKRLSSLWRYRRGDRRRVQYFKRRLAKRVVQLFKQCVFVLLVSGSEFGKLKEGASLSEARIDAFRAGYTEAGNVQSSLKLGSRLDRAAAVRLLVANELLANLQHLPAGVG